MIDIINAKDKALEEILESIEELEEFVKNDIVIDRNIYFLGVGYLYSVANEKWCK